VYSCSYDREVLPGSTVSCDTISYSQHVDLIVKSSCAIPGCHVAGTGLPNYNDFPTFQAKAADAKKRTQERDMPRQGSLTQQEIDIIACWVDNGALDN